MALIGLPLRSNDQWKKMNVCWGKTVMKRAVLTAVERVYSLAAKMDAIKLQCIVQEELRLKKNKKQKGTQHS